MLQGFRKHRESLKNFFNIPDEGLSADWAQAQHQNPDEIQHIHGEDAKQTESTQLGITNWNLYIQDAETS
jgi:hypothetical protein